MQAFSFVHTADIHLDSGFKGISEVDERVGSYLKNATFSSFQAIIQYCIANEVDFLLISGDIYNEEDRSLRAQLKFQSGMEMLNQHGIQVYLVHGNHDSLKGWSAGLDYPSNVHIFSGKKAETFQFEKEGELLAKITGISFLTRDIQDNLSNQFPKMQSSDPLFHIGLLHCNVGNHREHEAYAPCSLNDLLDHQLDYWALGHIHAHQILHQEPWVVYSGNSQGLNPKETGPRGFYHISVHQDKHLDLQFVPSDTIRWFINDISIRDMQSIEELRRRLADTLLENRKKADSRPSIARIILKDRGALAPVLQREKVLQDLVESLREMESDEMNFVWVEKMENRTEWEIDKELTRKQNSFLGDLMSHFDAIKQDKTSRDQVIAELDSLFQSSVGKKHLILPDPDSEEMLVLLTEAENICLSQLQPPPSGIPVEEVEP